MMAIGGAALAGCNVEDDTNREAAVALVNADDSNDRREIESFVLVTSKTSASSEDNDARNAVASEECVLAGCILLVAERFVGDNPCVALSAVNASTLATHINRHANTKRLLGMGRGSIIVIKVQCRYLRRSDYCRTTRHVRLPDS